MRLQKEIALILAYTITQGEEAAVTLQWQLAFRDRQDLSLRFNVKSLY